MPAYDANTFNPPAPLARVTLRNQDNGNSAPDVPMLIDTGADVTLVPQAYINQVGLRVDPNESYELMGFDGPWQYAITSAYWLVHGKP
jgi:predicted aspartyl protease